MAKPLTARPLHNGTQDPEASQSSFTIDRAVVDGQTIAQWTQNWWTWALQSPSDQNPLTDTTGQFAAENNSGPVFFIAGEALGLLNTPVTRAFDVPAGKPLLVPLQNLVDTPPEYLNNGQISPSDPTASADPRIKATESTNVAKFDKSVTNLFAEIDGKPIPNLFSHLVNTSFFSAGTTMPNTVATELVGAPPGTMLDPSKSGGFWLMIANLSPGQHTLHFGGDSNGFSASFGNYTIGPSRVDITDKINVV